MGPDATRRATVPGYAGRPTTKAPNWHAPVTLDLLFNNLSTGLFLVMAIGELVAPMSFRPLGMVAYPLTLLFLVGRATGEYSLMSNPAYRPKITWDQLMLTNRQFLGDLFFLVNRVTPAIALWLWGVLALLAWATKSRTLRFAWLFLMLSVHRD